MYLHEVLQALQDGKKVARLMWPKGDYMKSASGLNTFELDAEESKFLGVKAGVTASVEPTSNVYVNADGVVTIGHLLDSDDKQSQDWTIL